MAKTPLTKRQHDVFHFLVAYRNEHGFPPSMREVCAKFGFASTNSASTVLVALEKKGYVKREKKGKSRSLTLLSDDMNTNVERLKSEGIAPLPLIGGGSVDDPMAPFINPQGTVKVDKSFFCDGKVALFASMVEDDGLSGIGIFRGDIAIVRQQSTAAEGDIVLFLYQDVKLLRRYERQGGVVVLAPVAKGFPKVKTDRKHTDIALLGKAVGTIRKL